MRLDERPAPLAVIALPVSVTYTLPPARTNRSRADGRRAARACPMRDAAETRGGEERV